MTGEAVHGLPVAELPAIGGSDDEDGPSDEESIVFSQFTGIWAAEEQVGSWAQLNALRSLASAS